MFKVGESRDQLLTFPETIDEYLPDNHLAKLVLLIILPHYNGFGGEGLYPPKDAEINKFCNQFS